MKTKKHRALHLLIAAIAIINLAFLFLFQYGLSDATPAVKAAENAAAERAAYDEQTGFSSRTAPESSAAIVTSGTGEEGSAEGAEDSMNISGEEDAAAQENAAAEGENSQESAEAQNAQASEAGQNGQNLSDSQSGQNSASGQALQSSEASSQSAASNRPESQSASQNMSGKPEITLTSSLPSINQTDLPNLAEVLHDLGHLSASDGFGNDISSQITADYTELSADSMQYHVVFSVTNRTGQTATKETTINTQGGDHPVLELTSEDVTVPLNESFDYTKYIKIARDADGSSMVEALNVTGFVNTNYSELYILTYSLTSNITGETIERELRVTVE